MTTIMQTLLGSDTPIEMIERVNENTIARHSIDVTSVTTAYAALTTDQVILCDATGGAFTVTLYAVSGNAGRILELAKTDASGNAVTVDGAGSEKINNATTQSLASRYSSTRILCTGSEWIILSKNL